MDRTANFYSSPSYVGGSFPVFSGSRRQRGGSIFGALKNFFMPILTGFGKKLAKRGAKEAFGLAKDVARDALSNKNVSHTIKALAVKISDWNFSSNRLCRIQLMSCYSHPTIQQLKSHSFETSFHITLVK